MTMKCVSNDSIYHEAVGEYWGPANGFFALRAVERSEAMGPLADLLVGSVGRADALLLFTTEAAITAFFGIAIERYTAVEVYDGDVLIRTARRAGLRIALDLRHHPSDECGVLYVDVTSGRARSSGVVPPLVRAELANH